MGNERYTISDMLRDAEENATYERPEFPDDKRCILGSLPMPEVRRAPLPRRIRYGVASALRSLANKIEGN
jgi:hypothetical protein